MVQENPFDEDVFVPDHVSFTQVNMMLRCAKQYEFRYVMGLKTPPSGNLIRGKGYHSAQEFNYKSKLLNNQFPPIEEVLDAFSDAFEQAISDEEEGVDWEEAPPGFYKDTGSALTELYAVKFAPRFQPLQVEEYFEIPTQHEMNLIGYIDLVALQDKRKVLADHKATAKAPAAGKHDLQMRTYQLAKKYLNVPIDTCQIHAAVSTNTPKIVISEYPLATETELERTEDLINGVIRMILSGIFPPSGMGTWACNFRWCGYFNMCQGKDRF